MIFYIFVIVENELMRIENYDKIVSWRIEKAPAIKKSQYKGGTAHFFNQNYNRLNLYFISFISFILTIKKIIQKLIWMKSHS